MKLPDRPTLVRWSRRLLAALAIAYPAALVVVALMVRFVGESWWVTGVCLYLPRWGFGLPLPILAVALAAFRMKRLLLVQALSALLVLFPLMGFVVPWPTFASHDKPTMRVLSYNLNSTNDGAWRVMDEIARYSPDVVLLQEIGGHRALELVVPTLRQQYPTVEVTHNFILATRYPMSPEGPSSKAPEYYQRYPLETALGHVVVYNVHTVSPRHALFPLRGRRGLLAELRSPHPSPLESNALERESQVQTFTESAAMETDPVLIAGDTNLPGLSRVFARFLSSYDDGFPKAGWGFGYTFPTYRGGPWMRIDRILTKAPLRFVSFQVGRAFAASDHLCVVADLQR
jgi:endonuclease/exonuclease/phosphatase (EEP) superfamily protein YafD